MIAKEQQFSNILVHLSDELDIPQDKYNDAVAKYTAVGDWLGNSTSILSKYNPRIYAQGSIALGTIVKPIGSAEYDVDLVCQMEVPEVLSQGEVKRLVGERLNEHNTYSQILKSRNRCWCLDYSGQFHMDIIPAKQDLAKDGNAILIPDRDLRQWTESNPLDYIQWFKTCMKIRYEELRKEFVEARIDDIPEYRIKTPLQRAIQILKRHRDITFSKDQENKPISIIITTLAAKAYKNEASIYEALFNIINNMPNHIEFIRDIPVILNPTNKDENFADKWHKHPEKKRAFLFWLKAVQNDIVKILNIEGLANLSNELSYIFGSNSVNNAMIKYTETITEARNKSTLRFESKTGLLGAGSITVKNNTFYGK